MGVRDITCSWVDSWERGELVNGLVLAWWSGEGGHFANKAMFQEPLLCDGTYQRAARLFQGVGDGGVVPKSWG